MILTGWKQVSTYLGYGVRTVQRWESQGLPVKRVTKSPRSPVVADSEQLDAWILRGKGLPPGTPVDLLRNLERARELLREVEGNRKALDQGMASLRRKMAEIRTRKRSHLR